MLALPTLVSFYAGDRYYHDAAAALRGDCQRLGMPHHVEELDARGLDWAQICRLKISFYRRMQDRFGTILWVDVDARLLRLPDVLAGCRLDLVGFGGRYRYIRDYDSYSTGRFWVPSVLMLGDTPNGRAFVDRMAAIEQETETPVTDDYVLHEAWTRFPPRLNVGFLAPSLATRNRGEATEETVFLLGDSGNVSAHRGNVTQHSRPDADPRLRAQVLTADAVDAMKAGERQTALLLTRRAAGHAPDSAEVVLKHAEYLRINGEHAEATEVLSAFLERDPLAAPLRQSLVKGAMADGRFALADEHLALLQEHPDRRVRAVSASLAFDVDLERRATARGLRARDRVPLWWMKTPYPGNFGDVLSPYVVEQVSGAPPRFVSRGAGMLAIGSIIKFAKSGTVVWGSGTPRRSDTLAPDADYRAVRGPITREVVLRSGGRCPEVYGDPGLLLPRFYRPRNVRPDHALGLVRHVAHDRRPLRVEGVRDISLLRAGYRGIEEVVDEILSCEAVLSTSLHGVITANAYGIPARWCFFGDDATAVAGDGTKFEDYFRSVGLPSQQPLDLAEHPVIDGSLRRHVDRQVEPVFDAERLLEAFHRPA